MSEPGYVNPDIVLAKKILGIVKSHHEFDESRVKKELSMMVKLDIIKDLWKLHEKVLADPTSKGSLNDPNSLVAYLLGITTAKPIGEFVNEKRRTYGRKGFPDIDMDFDYERRHEIEKYIREKYGDEHVGQIGTIQRLKTKAALRRVIKALDPEHSMAFDSSGKQIRSDQSSNFQLQNDVVKTLPGLMKRNDGSFVKNVEEAYKEYHDFARHMDEYPEVYRVTKRMEGGISAFGCHAAGVVISPIPLRYICPQHVTQDFVDIGDTKKHTVATQFTMSEVEALGLIKFDVLGLSTKTAISLSVKLIKENRGVDIDVANLPLKDQETLRLLSSGRTDGCFQLENTGMKQTLAQIGIDSFDDLVVAIAMYRPGPKDYIPEFAKRKRNPQSVRYVHPIVQRYTEKTYGIIVYQEQAMQIFVDLAGLTPTEGYTFIKGSAKKDPTLFMSMKNRFIEGATRTANKSVAENVWKQMEPFQGYAFNKSHACSYAYESWKTAYLKAHYPVEFMAARLSVEAVRRNFDDVDKYEADVIKSGIKILPTDLNQSKMHYSIVGENKILRPLVIKDVGDKAAEEIIKHQPYDTKDILYSFFSKVGKIVNQKVVEALCKAGLFGKITKKAVLSAMETIRSDQKRGRGEQQGDMFG